MLTETTALGIDIGGTSAKLALVSHSGDVLWTAKSRTYDRPDTETLIRAIRDALREQDLGGVCNVGLCVPGLLSSDGNAIELSVNVPGLMNVPFDELVRRSIGSSPHTTVVNDAIAATRDYLRLHDLVGRTFALAIGTGVGAAVIDEDGTSIQIEGNSPGHFGMIDVSLGDDETIGPDGGAGSLEGYIGAAALGGRAPSSLTVKDPAIRALVRAIRIAHAIYRPHNVVLVGGIGIRLKHLADNLRAAINRKLSNVARSDWKLSSGDDDFHAARGAANASMNREK